jgi:LPPG:FO 2-phospho-L-lactate transferase
MAMKVLALAGGVGGAKLAHGLQQILGTELTVIVNTGDDFEHLGLTICPDIDTVLYTLAGLNNPETGWGLLGESWAFLDALQTLGGPSWFRLGDRDLATHLWRTTLLAEGKSLGEVVALFRQKLGVMATVLPMTNDRVRTLIHSNEGVLPFQEYFVARRCEPVLQKVTFSGIEQANPHPAIESAIAQADIIVFCPSNPFVSIEPILSIPKLKSYLMMAKAPIVAVSPIIAQQALKGPAAKMLRELGKPSNAVSVAGYYRARKLGGVLDGFVVHSTDRTAAFEIEKTFSIPTLITDTIMRDIEQKEKLASTLLTFAGSITPSPLAA